MEYRIDAKGKRLGRLASEIAVILQGKKSAKYEPRLVGSDKVFLENYRDVKVTGRKTEEKLYHRHTGYMGHLRTLTYAQKFAKDPKRVIWDTVRHMLPKNFLNQRRRKNLIFVEK
ncbi:MAG: 50S ribosomal protein L13 [Candidatus Liptonbacteria bacterium]